MSGRSPEFDAPSPLLPTTPPARAARVAGALLLVLAFAFGLFATLVPLPQVALAPFELVTGEDADALQAPIAGEIVRVAVAEGERVQAGQVLFELTQAELRERASQRRQLAAQRQAAQARGEASERAHAEALAIANAELAVAMRELEFRRGHVRTQQDLVARAERLGLNGVVAEVELLKYRLALAESEMDFSLGEREVERLRLALREREAERARARGDEAAGLALLDERIGALDGELADSDGRLRRVRAPWAGVVVRLPARTPGSVVAAGEVLAQLARDGATLRARLRLPEDAVPMVRVGQSVRLQLDAFPYQRHGSVTATLRWTSPTPMVDGEGRGFVADADPGATAMPLRAGMRGTARVEIGRRTLARRALEPLRGLRERWTPGTPGSG